MTTNKDAANVEIVNYTENALELLIYTKSGRLNAGTTLNEIMSWSRKKKNEHLAYMVDTIKTSFEFVDYVFEIKNVSRAFTHQLVRTRTASYQQQSQRTVDASNFFYLKPVEDKNFDHACEQSLTSYKMMLINGIDIQDARGVLPTAIHTEIFIKANLRTLSQMAELRLCKRAAGEYQSVFKKMVSAILDLHPWAKPLLECYCVKTGICYFPRYSMCPVQGKTIKVTAEKKALIKDAWEKSQHVASPIVNKNGMTM